MKALYVFGLILVLALSACATQIQQAPEQVTTPEPAVREPVTGEQQQPEDMQEEVVLDEEQTASDEIVILGKAGFEPDEMTIATGSAVTWLNNDAKDLTLNFFKEGKFMENSGLIRSGERFEKVFEEAGSYEFSTVAYGVKGTLTVE